jgi:inner membrane protein
MPCKIIMPTAFTHGFVALALGKTVAAGKMPLRFWVLSALCAVLPDADVIGFRYGIRYGDMLGHRGFSHSLLFALLLGMLVVFLFFRDVPKFSKKWWALAAYFFVVTASHGLLDAMTTGGFGIGFFIPFDDTRYFLPWRPVAVSAIRLSKFFSMSSMHVLRSEFIWVWIPAMLLTAGAWMWRRRHGPSSELP